MRTAMRARMQTAGPATSALLAFLLGLSSGSSVPSNINR